MSSPDEHEVLVRAEGVSKKFCRSLKRSLWYGVNDIASALNPFKSEPPASSQDNGLPALRKDEFWAVQNVSFALRRGECLGLIGHNGAGKSTLLKILNGLIPPDAGSITMKGRVAALIELNAGFNPILSGRENIFNQASLLGFTREETLAKFDKITEFAEIGDFLDMPVQNYSSGMRVRLGFAIAAQMEPDILIIDEVLAVGDIGFQFKCLNALANLMHRAAVIFVSHSMPQVFRVSTHAMLLKRGMVAAYGLDVSTSIQHYYQMAEDSPPSIAGTGEVVLENVRTIAEEGVLWEDDTPKIEHGEDVSFEFTLRATRDLGPVWIRLVIWNQAMLPVADVSINGQNEGYSIEFNSDQTKCIKVALKCVQLSAGNYTISLIASSHGDALVYLRHDNACKLIMGTPSQTGSCVTLIGHWMEVGK